MQPEPQNLDTLVGIEAHYRATLLNHAVHHSNHTYDSILLFPHHRSMDADHTFQGEHSQHLADYLGQNVAAARVVYFRDLTDQLDKIRSSTFSRDHEFYSAAGFPERDALNPKGKPGLAELTRLVKTSISALEPFDREGAGHAEQALHEKQLKELSRALKELQRRYENALTPPPGERPLIASRQTLLAYSRTLVESMEITMAAALGQGHGQSR